MTDKAEAADKAAAHNAPDRANTEEVTADARLATREAPRPGPGVKAGMFGARDTGDTSGFGGLLRYPGDFDSSQRPFGGYFDEVVDALLAALAGAGAPAGSILRVLVDRGELTLYLRPDMVATVCRQLRDDPALRFELCSSVSGVDYHDPSVSDPEKIHSTPRLHAVYHLTSMTFRRRIRLETAVSVEHPHVPSVVEIYPTANWHERETYDMFGIVFDGHPALTRILMPDDWDGHPQRKDYPLGGIPVEYKGATIPPPDDRRSYR
jgi:NADH-quinone oxidoreductase subunit C